MTQVSSFTSIPADYKFDMIIYYYDTNTQTTLTNKFLNGTELVSSTYNQIRLDLIYTEDGQYTTIEENINPGADYLYYYQPSNDYCLPIKLNLTGDTQLSDYIDYVSSNLTFVQNASVAWDSTGTVYSEYKYYDTFEGQAHTSLRVKQNKTTPA